MPPIDVIDRTLNDWISRIARIGKSIDTLSQNPAFLRLKAQKNLGTLTGQTKERASIAVPAADELWRLYLVLDKSLLDAAALRDGKNPFTADSRYAKIDALVSGPSINVESDVTSLNALQLDGGPRTSMSLQDVHALMDKAFCDIRDTVSQAESGWDGQSELDPARQRMIALETEAQSLGFAVPGQISEARLAIDDAQAAINADPLGANAAITRINHLIEKADAALSAARADQTTAVELLKQSEQRLNALAGAYDSMRQLRELRLAKIADPQPTADLIADPAPYLAAWLARIKAVQAAGRARAGLIGLSYWTRQIETDETAIASIKRQDQKVLDARADLRGHFTAIKARADDLAAKGQLSPESADLLAKTASLLFGAATPLPEAVQLIKRCDKI